MKWKMIFLFLVAIVGLVIVLLVLFLGNNKISESPINDEISNLEGENIDGSSGGFTGSGFGDNEGGEGEGGSIEGSQSGGNSNCRSVGFSYSAGTFTETETCNEFDVENSEICVDKTIDCSVIVRNLDDVQSGIFGVTFNFIEEGNPSEILGTDYFEKELSSSEEFVFPGSYSVQSTGENGVANKDLRCFYRVNEVPTKEVC